MIKPIMKTKFALPFIAAGTMCLTGCNFNTDEKLHDYMLRKAYPKKTLDSILDATKRDDIEKEAVVRQSTVDSMAYRELLYSTELVKDSAAVAKFNKIPRKASLEKVEKPHSWQLETYKDHIVNTAIKDGISVGEADELKSHLNSLKTDYLFDTRTAYAATVQAYADEYFYKNFFKGYNLLNDPKFKKEFKRTANKLDVNIIGH